MTNESDVNIALAWAEHLGLGSNGGIAQLKVLAREIRRLRESLEIETMAHEDSVKLYLREKSRAEAAKADNKRLREALEKIDSDFDCDGDAHKYKTICRKCLAKQTITASSKPAGGWVVYDQPCYCQMQKGQEPGHVHSSKPAKA